MENASKALIMAATILIGVMIISILVYAFNMFARYSEEKYNQIEDVQIAEFNEKFYKFYGNTTDSKGNKKTIECTIHDIVSLANFAQKYNYENSLIKANKKGDNAYSQITGITTYNSSYVQVVLVGESNNLELKTNTYLTNLIKKNDLIEDDMGKKTQTKYYKCTKCETRGDNKTVNYVEFTKIK